MRIRHYVGLLFGSALILLLVQLVACDEAVVTELFTDYGELAKPVLVFSVPHDKSTAFRKPFSVKYPGVYAVSWFTILRNKDLMRYELPKKLRTLVGQIRIYGNDNSEIQKHEFKVEFPTTVIGQGLFSFVSPRQLPLNQKLEFEC